MSRVVVIEPPQPVVTLDEAKAHLKRDGDDDNVLIAAMVAAATGHIDGPAGWLGRTIGVQTLEATLDGFVYDPITLPYRPIIDVVGIRYEDVTGVWRDLPADVYDLRGECLGTAWGKSWPGTRAYRGASRSVQIRYRAGYAPRDTDDGPVDTVPHPIKAAILLMVGDLYRNRDTTAAAAAFAIPMSTTVEALLAPFRVYA